MTTRTASLSGRVMTMLGIAAAEPAPAEDDVRESAEPIEAAEPAPEPVAEPEGDGEPEGDDAEPEADTAEMVREAAAIATKAANQRWQTVLASEQAKGRSALAIHLLGTTEMTADAICKTLAISPAAGSGFAARMAGVENPNVTPTGIVGDEPVAHQDNWNKAIKQTRGSVRS